MSTSQQHFNQPMGSLVSDQEARCRNVDNTSVYQFRRQALETAYNTRACYAPASGIMTTTGPGDRQPPNNLIDIETQLRRGAGRLTSSRTYRPEAATASTRAIQSVMQQKTPLPQQCSGAVRPPQMTSLRRGEFPEYSLFRPDEQSHMPVPSGTILPGIDTRRELKDAWRALKTSGQPCGRL